MPEIRLENLVAGYTSRKSENIVLDGLNATFSNGSLTVIMGESGGGKTTLLRSILGYVPYEGNIYFDNVLTDNISTKDMQIAYVSQNYALYPHMTIFHNIAFPLKLIGASRKEIESRVYEIADKLGISDCLSRKPKHISGGQQQRVALARALIKKPKICLLDEPLSNVDESLRFELLSLMKDLFSNNEITTIYVTHNLAEAEYLSKDILVIEDKKLIKYHDSRLYKNENPKIESK